MKGSQWLLVLLLFCSCASKNSFQSFYKTHKNDAGLALAVPAYLAKVAIPKENRKEILPLLSGVKKIRFLLSASDGVELASDFDQFSKSINLTPYFLTKSDGNKIEVFAQKQDDRYIREFVLRISTTEGETVLVGLIGKVDLDQLERDIQKLN